MARPAPSVTQVQGDGIIGVARHNPDGRFHRLPVRAQLHHIAVGHAQLPGARGTDQRGVVPGQLGERLGQFLQPAIVGETAIPNGGIGAQDNFDSACAAAFAAAAESDGLSFTGLGARAESATTPLFSEVCQNCSKSAPGFCRCQ